MVASNLNDESNSPVQLRIDGVPRARAEVSGNDVVLTVLDGAGRPSCAACLAKDGTLTLQLFDPETVIARITIALNSTGRPTLTIHDPTGEPVGCLVLTGGMLPAAATTEPTE